MSLPHRLPAVVPRLETRPSWITQSSPLAVRALSAAIGGGVFGFALLLDSFTLRGQKYHKKLRALANASAGIAAGLGVAGLLEQTRERRQSVVARLAMVEDMNHHIRNALEAIELSAYATQNEVAIHQIQEAVERIEWSLREILPLESRGPILRRP